MSGATLRASWIALTALTLGTASMLLQVGSILLSTAVPGLGGLSVIWQASIPIALAAVAGTVTAIVALARRARPTWMGVVGLVLSGIPLLVSLLYLGVLLLVYSSLSTADYLTGP